VDKSLYCVNCEEKFKSGAWYNCQGNPTRKHVVESRTFYSPHDRECVNVVPQSSMIGNQGERITLAGIIVTFFGGTYSTTDPQVQEVLERECPMTKEQYMNARMTPELKAGRDRKVISDQQELIDKLKAENEELKSKPKASKAAPADAVMARAGRGKNRQPVAAD
jgi:hypothetical protein